MAMCYNCYIRSVEYAIENGIDVNDSGREGMTALDIALDSGNGMRLGLWTNFARERGRLPKRSDQIIDAIFHNDGFGDEFKQSESSDNNVYAAKSRYMTFQKISQRLIAADAQTGKQLQRRDRAPDIKQREKEVPGMYGVEEFDIEDQPYYELWQHTYQFDDETEEENERIRNSRIGWSIPPAIRELETQHPYTELPMDPGLE
ncbi:Ank-2 domain containing protein [Pyrenophora tritici-repentis]|nr:Ank-2 domain containing protein [Pyrenophora tritici-repentis]